MITFFNEDDLVDFGKFLFSSERAQNFIDNEPNSIDAVYNIKARIKKVTKEDVNIFLGKSKIQPVVTVYDPEFKKAQKKIF